MQKSDCSISQSKLIFFNPILEIEFHQVYLSKFKNKEKRPIFEEFTNNNFFEKFCCRDALSNKALFSILDLPELINKANKDKNSKINISLSASLAAKISKK